MRKSSMFSNAIRLSAVMLSVAVVANAAPFGFNGSGQNSSFGWAADAPTFGHTGTDNANMGSPLVGTSGFEFNNHFGDMDYSLDDSRPNIDSHVEWAVSINGGVALGVPVSGSNPGGATPITQVIVRESGTYSSADPVNDFSVAQSIGIQPLEPFFPYSAPVQSSAADVSSRRHLGDRTHHRHYGDARWRYWCRCDHVGLRPCQ